MNLKHLSRNIEQLQEPNHVKENEKFQIITKPYNRNYHLVPYDSSFAKINCTNDANCELCSRKNIVLTGKLLGVMNLDTKIMCVVDLSKVEYNVIRKIVMAKTQVTQGQIQIEMLSVGITSAQALFLGYGNPVWDSAIIDKLSKLCKSNTNQGILAQLKAIGIP